MISGFARDKYGDERSGLVRSRKLFIVPGFVSILVRGSSGTRRERSGIVGNVKKYRPIPQISANPDIFQHGRINMEQSRSIPDMY